MRSAVTAGSAVRDRKRSSCSRRAIEHCVTYSVGLSVGLSADLMLVRVAWHDEIAEQRGEAGRLAFARFSRVVRWPSGDAIS